MSDFDTWMVIALTAIVYISMISCLVLYVKIENDEYDASYREERHRQQEWDRKFREMKDAARTRKYGS